MPDKLEALRDFLSGQPDNPTIAALRQELSNPESEANSFLEGLLLVEGKPKGARPVPGREIEFPESEPYRRRSALAVGLAIGIAVLLIANVAVTFFSNAHELQSLRRREQALTQMLQAKDEQIREQTDHSHQRFALLIERQDLLTRLVAEGLIKSLDDKKPSVRKEAAGYLGEMGRVAEAALPALRKRLELEKDPEVLKVLSTTVGKMPEK